MFSEDRNIVEIIFLSWKQFYRTEISHIMIYARCNHIELLHLWATFNYCYFILDYGLSVIYYQLIENMPMVIPAKDWIVGSERICPCEGISRNCFVMS